ncbi:MAG: hypothetical protein K8S14_03160, partial [Actinomycetia bacterium]|nr:hypothetical protein [Actinomycetes bacterium]
GYADGLTRDLLSDPPAELHGFRLLRILHCGLRRPFYLAVDAESVAQDGSALGHRSMSYDQGRLV